MGVGGVWVNVQPLRGASQGFPLNCVALTPTYLGVSSIVDNIDKCSKGSPHGWLKPQSSLFKALWLLTT